MLARQLEHFLYAYERKSFKSAAQALNLTQPALTKSIRLLEESLGVILFDRRAHGVSPTVQGDTLAAYARSVVKAWHETQAKLTDAADGIEGEITLAASASFSLRAAPMAMVEFHREFPRIKLTLETGVAPTMRQRLSEGEIDLYIGSIIQADADHEIEIHPLGSSQLAPFVRADHPLAVATGVSPSDLHKYPWVSQSYSVASLDAINAYFRKAAVEPRKMAMRFNSITPLLICAANSDCIGFVPSDLEPEARLHGVVPLNGIQGLWSFPIGIAFRRNLRTLRHFSRLIELIEAQVSGTASVRALGSEPVAFE